jgi:hypothetical protein
LLELNFKYGDACQSGDDKFVIAQFRADAQLGWVQDLRSHLQQKELKYKEFHRFRHRVQANTELWAKVQQGVFQAEITITNPKPYRDAIILDWLDQQAEPGIDFDEQTVNEQTGQRLIELSPLGIANISPMELVWQYDINPMRRFMLSSDTRGMEFRPATLKQRAGGGLKDALILSARSHAMVSPSERRELTAMALRLSNAPIATRLALIAKMARIFDMDHPNSVEILNEFSDHMIHAAGVEHFKQALSNAGKMVSEQDSKNVDHIQAADMAAGWAVDILLYTGGEYRELAKRFASVSVNGVAIPG